MLLAAIVAVCGLDGATLAAGLTDGQMGLQEAVTPIAREIQDFYNLVNIIIIAITIFVLLLLGIVIVRFNEKANPVPSKTTHNTLLEVAWTVLPVIILVVIAIPSFKLLGNQYDYPKPDLTIKAIGHQWRWEHQYLDQGNFKFDSNLLDEEGRQALIGKNIPTPRMLAVDNEVFVPVNKVVHVLVTASDVIHAWTIPSFGSKTDAVPGRLTTTWFKAEKEGVYYGQCSELCGVKHSAMPIAVRVVKQEVFDAWVAARKARDRKLIKKIQEDVALEHAGVRAVSEAKVP